MIEVRIIRAKHYPHLTTVQVKGKVQSNVQETQNSKSPFARARLSKMLVHLNVIEAVLYVYI
jgi:hypothetical protein